MAKKENYVTKSKEEIKNELDELIEKSLDKIKDFSESPEDMIEFANFMSKIHDYSITNLTLIDSQFRGAQAVASYADWKKNGFQVQKGEKGIKIYAYTPYVMFTDENGEKKQLKEATPRQKEKIKKGELKSSKITSFKPGHVFDVSQTNATPEDLPKIFPNKVWNFKIEDENNIDQLEKGINSLANSLNINIRDMKESKLGELGVAKGAYAQYLNGKEEIVLNSRNTRTQNISTSIHELAHKKLHNKDRLNNLPEDKKALGLTDTEIKEFQAEMTSYIVCKNYGMDTSEKAIPYVAKWTQNGSKIDPRLTRDILTDIKNTATEFIENIDKTILAEKERQQEQQLKGNSLKEIEVNEQQPNLMAPKNSFENDLFKVEKKVTKDKLIEELKDIAETEEILRINNDTYDYRHKQKLILSERLRNLLKESNLPEDDFINLKETFNVSTKLDLYETKNNFQEVFEDEEEFIFENSKEIKKDLNKLIENSIDRIKDYPENLEDMHEFAPVITKDALTNVKNAAKEFSEIVDKTIGQKQPESALKNSFELNLKVDENLNNLNNEDTFNKIKDLDIEILNLGTKLETNLENYDKKEVTEIKKDIENIGNQLFNLEKNNNYEQNYQDNNFDNGFNKFISYGLSEIALDECIYNLSDNADMYYDKDNWDNEIENQLNYTSITQLASCDDPQKFYKENKDEIEQILDSYKKEDIRSNIEMNNYEDIASLIAYKTVIGKFQNNENFKIPDHSELQKPIDSSFQGMEME